jgi:hypothetical protein
MIDKPSYYTTCPCGERRECDCVSPLRLEIFVFGSNRAGIHGKGAALHAAKHYGAIYGQGWGLQGKSFAIPTKDHRLNTLPLYQISMYVNEFKEFASQNPQFSFKLSPIGCGLAGYSPVDIAPMFADAPDNVILPEEFALILKGMK